MFCESAVLMILIDHTTVHKALFNRPNFRKPTAAQKEDERNKRLVWKIPIQGTFQIDGHGVLTTIAIIIFNYFTIKNILI